MIDFSCKERHFYGLVNSSNLPPIEAINWSSPSLTQDMMLMYLTDKFDGIGGIMKEILRVRHVPSNHRISGIERARQKLWEFGWCPQVAD